MDPIVPESFPISLDSYDDPEKKVVVKETNDLISLWNAQIDTILNGSLTDGIHPPPALSAMYCIIHQDRTPLDALIEIATDDDSSTEDVAREMEATQMRILAVASAFFRFGQYCASNGLLYANMQQCNCDVVTDAALQAFIGGQ